MASTSETGNAKNAANFRSLISSVTGYGTTYNPSRTLIKLTSMQPQAKSADDVLKEEHEALSTFNNAAAARKDAFAPFNELITRSLNSLKSTDASDNIISTSSSIVRQLRGTRATPKPKEPNAQVNSSSQVGFDDKINNFDKYIKLLEGIPEYNPNETDLQLTSLSTLYTSLKTKNDAVVDAETALNNIRIKRDTIFNATDTGLIDVASDVKTYVKSVFGSTSPQYKQITKLKFKKIQKK